MFYAGVAFAYFVFFHSSSVFTTVGPGDISVMTDINRYLDFVLKLFFAFGLAFEVPIAAVILILTGVVSADQLANNRSYVVVGCFVIGMLLTPPDVISQTLLALPMWLLFELGLIMGRALKQAKTLMTENAVTTAEDNPPPKAKSLRPLRELLQFLWPHKSRLIAASLALVFTAMAQLSLGYGIQILIDQGFANQSQAGLRQAVVFMIVVGFAMASGAFIRFYLVSWLGERVSADLRQKVFNNLLTVHPGFYEKTTQARSCRGSPPIPHSCRHSSAHQ